MEKQNEELLAGLSIPIDFYSKYELLLIGIAGAFGDMAKEGDIENFDLFIKIIYRIAGKAKDVMENKVTVSN